MVCVPLLHTFVFAIPDAEVLYFSDMLGCGLATGTTPSPVPQEGCHVGRQSRQARGALRATMLEPLGAAGCRQEEGPLSHNVQIGGHHGCWTGRCGPGPTAAVTRVTATSHCAAMCRAAYNHVAPHEPKKSCTINMVAKHVTIDNGFNKYGKYGLCSNNLCVAARRKSGTRNGSIEQIRIDYNLGNK